MAKVKWNFACEQNPFLPFAEDEKAHSVPDHAENPGDQGCHAREPKLPLLQISFDPNYLTAVARVMIAITFTLVISGKAPHSG